MRDGLCFFLCLALRFLFLGEDGGGGKEGEDELFRQLVLWELPLHSGRCVWFLQGVPEAVETGDDQRGVVNPDATEILHVKRRKAPPF